MSISKGTTPTFTLTFDDENLDLTQAAHVVVSFKGSNANIEKKDTDLEITQRVISVYLNQSETLALSAGRFFVQVNWTYADGSRAASNIASSEITDNLVGRVIS